MSEYYFFEKFILRSPLKPLNNMVLELESLKIFYKNKQVQEALYLASPSLYLKLKKWLIDDGLNEKEKKSLITSLSKYYIRMHSRSTPFGLFAGCSWGKWSDKTSISFKKGSNILRHTRLDMGLLCRIVENIKSNEDVQSQILFFPNTSLYETFKSFRYLESENLDSKRKHVLNSIEKNVYLEKIIKNAEKGMTIGELSSSVLDDNIDKAEIKDFINELIASQILVSELEPVLTGSHFFHHTLQVLKKLQEKTDFIQKTIKILQRINENLRKIDNNIINSVEEYKKVELEISSLCDLIDQERIFQTDMFKKSNKTIELSRDIEGDLYNCLIFLNRTNPNIKNSNLTSFCKAFYEKYGDQEIRLNEALDSELGVGYPVNNKKRDFNPLIKGIARNTVNVERVLQLDNHQSHLLKLLIDAIKNEKPEIDISNFKNQSDKLIAEDLPDTFSCSFSLLDEKGKRIFFGGAAGSSGANIIGRFTHGNSEIKKIALDITSHEEKLNQDHLLAEIVHLPEPRLGNVVMHPQLRNFEIPYLANSIMSPKNKLSLNDLYISVSANNNIFLRSKKHNKVVIPRLSNAHNYSHNSLPVYNFLCDLQNQKEKRGLFFSWKNLENQFKFFPRVKWNNIILKPSTWKFERIDFQFLLSSNEKEFVEWKKKWKLPDQIVIVDSDRELLIDLKKNLSKEVFLEELRKRNHIVLSEFLFSRALVTKDYDGNSYLNQFYGFLMRKENRTHPKLSFNFEDKNQFIERVFPLGSRWIYYKIYSGTSSSDIILSKVILPTLDFCKKNDLTVQWFFIRYGDPEDHIRLRIELKSIDFLQKVLRQFNKMSHPYIENKIIMKAQTDVYIREIERYGNNTIELSENIFYYDSSSFVKFLGEFIENPNVEEYRWLYAVKSIDTFLNGFQIDLNDKYLLLERFKNSFSYEFNVDKEMRNSIQRKYRERRDKMISILENEDNRISDENLNKIIELITCKDKFLKQVYKKILDIKNKNELKLNFGSFVMSHVHVMINRIFKSEQRLCELVVYYLMYNHYKSLIARNKYKK